ncbi:MAG: response regulator transcription factor [Acidobacteria bacterium]|nr:response regulator transcription factor [Acidobacteriota bacterium]
MRVLIVDDEPLARQRIRQLLAGEGDLEVAGEAVNGLEAVRLIEELAPDLVFLDVQMPELDGFGVVESVGVDRMPATLFVTAFDQHAVKAFEVHALDYLLKPFDRERFRKALARVREWRGRPGGAPSLEGLLAEIRRDQPCPDRFLVRNGERYQLVKASAIQWVEAEDNYVRLHVEGASHLLRHTMGGILARLDPKVFRRIHRSAIVNLDFIKELQSWTGGDMLVVMRDGTRLTLSRTYRDQFAEWQ